MVFAKAVTDSGASQKAIRSAVTRKNQVLRLTSRLLKTIACKGAGELTAVRSRQTTLSIGETMLTATNRPNIDILFPKNTNAGSWASALTFIQQHVVEPGLELTTDHARRVISLWARGGGERPPVALLLRWWTLFSLDRPQGFDERVHGEASAALQLLPVVAGAMAGSKCPSIALNLISQEASVAGPSPQIALAVEEALAASVDPNAEYSQEQRAVESCSVSMGELSVNRHDQKSTLITSSELVRRSGVITCGVPSFSVIFSLLTGTLTKSSDEEDRGVFNGVACAIVASRPSPLEGIGLCDSFIGVTSPNTSCVLEELKLRYLASIDKASALLFFDSIPEVRRTPFMTAVCLRILVANGVYDGSVVYARSICEAWGPFALPVSALNRLCLLHSTDQHSEAFWGLMNLCSERVTERRARLIANHRAGTSWRPRILPVSDILVNLEDLASLGKVAGARAVMSRLPTVPRSRFGSSDDSLSLEVLGSMGDDWQLALEALQRSRMPT